VALDELAQTPGAWRPKPLTLRAPMWYREQQPGSILPISFFFRLALAGGGTFTASTALLSRVGEPQGLRGILDPVQ